MSSHVFGPCTANPGLPSAAQRSQSWYTHNRLCAHASSTWIPHTRAVMYKQMLPPRLDTSQCSVLRLQVISHRLLPTRTNTSCELPFQRLVGIDQLLLHTARSANPSYIWLFAPEHQLVGQHSVLRWAELQQGFLPGEALCDTAPE